MIPIKPLKDKINLSSLETLNSLQICQINGANSALDFATNAIKVPNIASLPSASNYIGRILYVEDIGEYRYSDGLIWKSNFDSKPYVFKSYAFSWGPGLCGELGVDYLFNESSPVSVVGGFTDWCQVSAGWIHALAVRCNGTAWSWGDGQFCQLGINDFYYNVKTSPMSITGGFTDWCQVTAGPCHSFGIRQNGTLWGWGCNHCQVLGFGGSAGSYGGSPASVGRPFTDWKKISTGRYHSLGLRCNGTLWAWGSALYGRVGNNTGTGNFSSPVSVVGGFTDWCQSAAGNFHSLGLRTNGTLWAWGDGCEGQLGNNIATTNIPILVSSPTSSRVFSDWCQVSASCFHNLLIRCDGTLYASGCGVCGILGTDTTSNRVSPASVVGGFTDWCQVSAGEFHSLALRTNCTLWSWGSNNCGQLGDNTITNRSSPVSVVGEFTDWCQVSAGGCHSLALRTNGTLWAWGRNVSGQLGDNTTTNRSSPVSVVGGFTDWCQISASSVHSLGLRTNGTLWAWGNSFSGRLGDNTTVDKSSPVSVVGGFTDWCQISAGDLHSLALRCNGTLWTWGSNCCGMLGNNSTVSRSSPVSVVGGFTDWCFLIKGSAFTNGAIRNNGTLWMWGQNYCGRLGDNSISNRSSPVSVVGGFTDWFTATSGVKSTLAIRTNGTLWAWGRNICGSFSTAYENNFVKSSPVSVVGGFTDWCQVTASCNQSLALRTNGSLWSWGCNNYGQLGNNSTANRSSPVSVVGGFTDWCQVSAGMYHALALRTNGSLWSWGFNNFGLLGDNTTTNRSSPVSVVGGFTDWCQVSAGDFTIAIRGISRGIK